MIKVLRTISDEARTCPCCGESHAVQEIVTERRIVQPGLFGTVPARYFYCANTDEYFEDQECAAFNAMQGVQMPFGGMPQM